MSPISIRDFFPISLQLGILAIILAAIIGITTGTFSAMKQNTFVDYFAPSARSLASPHPRS